MTRPLAARAAGPPRQPQHPPSSCPHPGTSHALLFRALHDSFLQRGNAAVHCSQVSTITSYCIYNNGSETRGTIPASQITKGPVPPCLQVQTHRTRLCRSSGEENAGLYETRCHTGVHGAAEGAIPYSQPPPNRARAKQGARGPAVQLGWQAAWPRVHLHGVSKHN